MIYTKQVKTLLVTLGLVSFSPFYSFGESYDVTQAIQTNNGAVSASGIFYYEAQAGEYPFYTNALVKYIDSYKGDFVRGTEFKLTDDQRNQLASLPTSYLPVTITIENNSDSPINLTKSSYVNELTKYVVPTSTVLGCYPAFSNDKIWMNLRNYGCWVGGPLGVIVGALAYAYAPEASAKTSSKASSYIVKGISVATILTSVFAIAVGANRMFTMPPSLTLVDASNNDFFAQTAELMNRLSLATISDAGDNVTPCPQTDSNYTIPAHTTFTETMFLDIKAFQNDGIPATLTLVTN